MATHINGGETHLRRSRFERGEAQANILRKEALVNFEKLLIRERSTRYLWISKHGMVGRRGERSHMAAEGGEKMIIG